MAGEGAGDRAAVDTAVCFALDDTLLAYDREYEAVVEETLATAYDAVSEEMVEGFLAAFENAVDAMAADPYHAAMAAVGDVDGDRPDEARVESLVDALLEAEMAATSVPEAARSCITALAADEAVAVCVVTDGLPAWQREKLAHHGLADVVTTVVTSYGVGGHKESGDPYDAVREEIDAVEYVMIGDDYTDDVEAARAAGFVPIHYEDDDGPDFFGTLEALL